MFLQLLQVLLYELIRHHQLLSVSAVGAGAADCLGAMGCEGGAVPEGPHSLWWVICLHHHSLLLLV